MNIVALTWPIFIEVLLRTALNTSDVFMLGSYSDLAVSAVGVITQIMFFLLVISMMVSSGTGILIAQYNGANKPLESSQVGVASLFLGLMLGLFLSAGSFVGAQSVIDLYNLDKQVGVFGYQYLIITGSLTINVTLGIVLSTILRSHGFSRSPMVVNLIAGIINLIGNYFALYQPFGLPVYGVQGVAIATVFGQFVGTVLMWGLIKRRNIELPMNTWKQIPITVYKKIIRIGMINAGEILSYNLSQMVIVYFVVKMGNSSLAAFTYAQNIARISFAFSLSIGQAGQIQTSYFIGKGWSDAIFVKIQRYFVVGFIASVLFASLLYLFATPIITLFTQDSEIVALTTGLLLGSILLEGGRVFNLIFIAALKGAGDVRYPVQIGILSMWSFGVGCSYLFGLYFGMGVIGAWLAVALDEWVRGLIMLRRWRSKKWVRFSFV